MFVAVAGVAAGNWFVTPPFRTWFVHSVQDVLALAVFLTTAVVISALVDLAARRAAEAERAGAEATALARLAATLAASDEPLHRLIDDLRRVARAAARLDDAGRLVPLAEQTRSCGTPTSSTVRTSTCGLRTVGRSSAASSSRLPSRPSYCARRETVDTDWRTLHDLRRALHRVAPFTGKRDSAGRRHRTD